MKTKPLLALLPALLLMLLPGCMDYQRASRQIERCPKYMQQNVGPVVCETSWKMLFERGFVKPDEPGCPMHLFPWADDNVVLEEAFHSFELRAGDSRYEEWERFYRDFHADGTTYRSYGGILSSAAILSVPMLDIIPVPGHVNFRATVSHFEDTAACFVHIVRDRPIKDKVLMRKCEAVKKFADGGYRNKP